MINHPANRGRHYPITSYCIGSDGHHVASFCGVEKHSNNYADHVDHCELLKSAEKIADAIYAANRKCEGCSEWLNRPNPPANGYCVGLHGWETKIDRADCSYKSIYRDVVDKLDWISGTGWDGEAAYEHPPCCIGSWVSDGQLYIDICQCLADLDDALDYAYCEGQIAIYDLTDGRDINVESEWKERRARDE
jgi:hypothetical protein